MPKGFVTRTDPGLDPASGGFFSVTLGPIERARVRPRRAWWPSFQLKAGLLMTESLSAGAERHKLLGSLDGLYMAASKA